MVVVNQPSSLANTAPLRSYRKFPHGCCQRAKWANPFKLSRDGDHNLVIAMYHRWLLQQAHLLAALPELRGKDLVCWCAPERCHGDILIELANTGPTS